MPVDPERRLPIIPQAIERERHDMNRDPLPAAPDTRHAVKGVQKMTPSEAFVETMVANGVTDIFGIMGSAFMDAMDIFAPAGIRLIPVVHEQGAAHMADGYARVRAGTASSSARTARASATASPRSPPPTGRTARS